MTDVHQLTKDLHALGVHEGRPLLVHTSVRSLGPLQDGLEGFTRALRSAVHDAALLVPTLSYDLIDWDAHLEGGPLFDIRATPSCIGAFPEFYRTLPDVYRSGHITHSVCASGAEARWFIDDHHLDDSPGGPRSPFRRLAERQGSILMVGCGLRPNTTMHSVEETAEPPYLFMEGRFPYRIATDTGEPIAAWTRRHDFQGVEQRYDRITDVVREGTELRRGRVGPAEAFLIDAEALFDRAGAALRRDPFFFVERA